MLVELGSLAEVLVELAGSRVVVQPDAATATPTAMAAVSLIEIGALTSSTRMPLLPPISRLDSGISLKLGPLTEQTQWTARDG